MELEFDKMDVDTTKAQFYSNKDEFISIFHADKAMYFDGKNLSTTHNYHLDKEYTEISRNLEKLAVLMKENINLFAELEYMHRKIPMEDTKAQLNLIIQHLYYLSSCNVDGIPNIQSVFFDDRKLNYSHFLMYQETSILNLGFVIRACVYLYPRQSIPSIAASKKTPELCYLFTTLCHDAGLAVVTEFGGTAVEYDHGKEALGTLGVVSESADVDSAVDVFLTSSKQVPWRLRKILVQESVYKQFKDALTWKCNLNITGDAKTTSSTSDILHFNGRQFLIDALDITDPKPYEVTVEAYRSRKELLSFLNQYRPHYVSLWANDIAEINEVAHSIPSQVVWVNNFAEFRGPPRISDAIFSVMPLYKSNSHLLKTEMFDVLLELQKSWLKLDNQSRYELLSKTLNGISKSSINVYSVFRKAQVYSHGTFVEVGKDYVCQGVSVPSDKIHYCTTNILNESFFRSLFRGNAFVFDSSKLTPEISLLINSLNSAGLPVLVDSEWLLLRNLDKLDFHICQVVFDFDHVTRVIWTNSGTIFAN